jgi:hypothetical protein
VGVGRENQDQTDLGVGDSLPAVVPDAADFRDRGANLRAELGRPTALAFGVSETDRPKATRRLPITRVLQYPFFRQRRAGESGRWDLADGTTKDGASRPAALSFFISPTDLGHTRRKKYTERIVKRISREPPGGPASNWSSSVRALSRLDGLEGEADHDPALTPPNDFGPVPAPPFLASRRTRSWNRSTELDSLPWARKKEYLRPGLFPENGPPPSATVLESLSSGGAGLAPKEKIGCAAARRIHLHEASEGQGHLSVPTSRRGFSIGGYLRVRRDPDPSVLRSRKGVSSFSFFGSPMLGRELPTE